MGTTSAVLGATIVITGTSVLKDVKKGQSPMMPVVTGFMLGSALLLIAMAAPQFAKALAGLGVVGALVTNGPDVLGTINTISKAPSAPHGPAGPAGPKGAN